MQGIASILAATDLTAHSGRAIGRAAQLASQFSAALTLVHVIEDARPEDAAGASEEQATAELEATAASLAKLHSFRCTARVVRGDAVERIAALTDEHRAGLVVMGAHRRPMLRTVLVGTLLERIVRTSPVPVLVVNADRPDPYRHVLAAIDLSECSGHALETAWQTGLVAGTQLTALHVCDPAEGMQRPDPHADAEGKRAAAMLEASRALAAFLDGLSLAGAAYALRVRTEDGPAGAAISRAAAELQADLVVAGRRGRNRVVRMLLGSVTDDLLTLLDTDILVVPCPANA